jgi:hypothetical protein
MPRWVATFVVLLGAGFSSAQTLYVPAAANAAGVNLTRWRTDLQVKAEGDEPASFTVELLKSSADNRDPEVRSYSVGAGQSLRLANLLASEFGFTGTAALRVSATAGRILATSRTFNDDPTGTFGQTVPAVDVREGFGPGDRAALIQLSRSPDRSIGFRTNLGVVNLTDQSIGIDIDLFHADGGDIGSVNVTLRPFEHRQVNDVFLAGGAADVDDGYAMVRTSSPGGRFLTYASVVDNASGDAVFVPGSMDALALPTADRLVVFEFLMRPGCSVCASAGEELSDLAAEFADDNVLFVEQDVDAPLGGRLDRWFDAYAAGGTVYLPLTMVDSGHQISTGPVDFAAAYRAMIEDSRDRPAMARMTVSGTRVGDLIRFEVRLGNDSGVTLSAANGAALTALILEEPASIATVPRVVSAAVLPLSTVVDGESRELSFEVMTDIEPERTRWVVIADYRPPGSTGAFDALQAVSGP